MQQEDERFLDKDVFKEKGKRLQFTNFPNPVRYSQDYAWSPVQYQGKYGCQGGGGYEGRYERDEYQQQYGCRTNQWQITDNNCFQRNSLVNEANLENNPVTNGNDLEDEFEQFLNGPFAKKYELLLQI